MKDMNDPLEIIRLLTLAREPDASVKTRAQLNGLLRGDERARKITSQFLADEASIALSFSRSWLAILGSFLTRLSCSLMSLAKLYSS